MTEPLSICYLRHMPPKKTNPKPKRARKSGPSQMPPKWLAVIDLMVIGGLNFRDAMDSAGYKPAYYNTDGYRIQHDPRFSKAYEHKKANLVSKSEDRREKRLKTLDKIIDCPDATHRDIVAAVQVQGRMCGWLSETIRHETTDRQAALDHAAQQEAARLAGLALDTRCLPDISTTRKAVASVITASSIPIDIESDPQSQQTSEIQDVQDDEEPQSTE